MRKSVPSCLEKLLIGSARFPPADVARLLHWSDYSAKTVAQIQARGMPIDMALWNAAQEYKPAVVRALIKALGP